MRTVVHVTHEAVEKIGGIGAVLEGLLTTAAYNRQVDRTVLVCPLFSTDHPANLRLGRTGQVLYSSVDGLIKNRWAGVFGKVQEEYNVGIVYGKRQFANGQTGHRVTCEVILIDLARINENKVNTFKSELWEHFGIDSIRYETCWDYQQWVRLARPALAALEAIGAVPEDGHCVIVSHEFMGMPTALASILSENRNYRTVFYAHEVAPIRKIVEDHPGHDTMFYNVLRAAGRDELFLEDVLGAQDHYYKHALVNASKYCDNILAVGDYVVKELRFLAPEFVHADIDLCYNGIPATACDLKQKLASKTKLQRYCEILLEYRPDYVFTHVSRMTVSKGLWRDLHVLDHIERAFRQQGKTAIMFMLATELPRRRPEDILHMEKWWQWPVAHREVEPDLSAGEAVLYAGIQEFNAKARNVKVLLINQFGFDRHCCGRRMPADIEFMDIRRGTDLEFGQSVYEPFGISMLEPLTFGGICVVSSVCGHVGFVRQVCGQGPCENVIVADYTDLDDPALEIEELLQIDQITRGRIEKRVARRVAERILRNLPKDHDQLKHMLETGYEIASHMDWNVVAADHFLPAIDRACKKQRVMELA